MKNTMVKAIIKNNANSGYYRVEAETDEAYTLVPVNPVVDDNGETEYEDAPADPMTMTKKVFEVVCSVVIPAPPTEITMQDVKVFDGKMTICGEPVECGTLYITKPVAVMPGGVIVEVRSKDGNGVDLKFYDFEIDDFDGMTYNKDAAELVYQEGDITAFLIEKRSDVSIPIDEDDEDEDEVCTVETAVDRSLRFYNRGRGFKMLSGIYGNLIDRRTTGTGTTDFIFATDGLKDVRDVNGISVTIEDDASGEKKTRAAHVAIAIENGRATVSCEKRTFKGGILEVLHGTDGNYTFVTDKDTIVNMNNVYNANSEKEDGYRMAAGKDVVNAVHRYPVPVSIDVPSRPITVFVFAKEDMTGVCRITVEKTHDRGYVTKIEEI